MKRAGQRRSLFSETEERMRARSVSDERRACKGFFFIEGSSEVDEKRE